MKIKKLSPDPEVTNVSLDPSNLSLNAGGETATLTATVEANYDAIKGVTWSSSDSTVATVNSNGVITPVGAGGPVTIKATSTWDNTKYAECVVTVNAATVAVTGVTLAPTTATLTAGGDAVALTATVTPDNATDKKVKWSVGGENSGAVKLYSDAACTTEVGTDATETLTVYAKGISAGSATVTATSNADSNKTASCAVTVNAATVAVTGVTLSPTTATLTAGGDAVALTATVAPENATDKKVKWSVVGAAVKLYSDAECTTEIGEDATDVLTVYAKGIAGGYEAEVNVTSNADSTMSATCAVTVNAATVAVTGVTLDNTTAEIEVGKTETLTATVTPANATDKTVTWTSSDTSVATVANGVVTAVGAGTATITAKAGDKSATCTVTVKSVSPAPEPDSTTTPYIPTQTPAPATTTPAATTPTVDITKYNITGKQDTQNQSSLAWDSVPNSSGYTLSIKMNGKYVFVQDLGTATNADVVRATNGKYYVSTGGDYTIYNYDKKTGKFTKTGTLAADKIDSVVKANNVTNDFMVKIKDQNGKETAESNSYKVSVKVYYKPAVRVTANKGSITIRWNKVPEAQKYRIYKYVNGRLKLVTETDKLALRVNGTKAGNAYTYAVRALVNGNWTKVYKSDMVSVTAK